MSASSNNTDNQANNIKDDYALTITEVLISGTYNTYETILHIQTTEGDAVKGGYYDFAGANDPGVHNELSWLGSEYNNLLNSSYRKSV